MNPFQGTGRFIQALFGDLSRDEFKKFTLFGLIYGVIIGLYWTLRVVKDSLFMCMVGKDCIPYAKLIALVVLFYAVIAYSRLLEIFPRQRMLYVLSAVYGCATLLFGYLFLNPEFGLANTSTDTSRILGWTWYVFVESYGALFPALFWAFATDTTKPDAARKGFPFVVMIAQTISICGPYFLTPLASAHRFGSSAYVVIAIGFLIFLIAILTKLLMNVVPESQLVGYVPESVESIHRSDKEKIKKDTSFFAGFKLFISKPYLLGIFALVAVYEIIITLIDFSFKSRAHEVSSGEAACTIYLGSYATWVNVISALCLLFGASSIQRRLGVKTSLIVMPCIVAVVVLFFSLHPAEYVFFWIMVFAKALNYAINSPSIKQLYVPTTVQARYQAQAWIDTFGARGAKAIGSGFNLLKKPLVASFGPQIAFSVYLALSSLFSGALLVIWFVVALYLGEKYSKAIEKKEVVC